MNDINQRSRAGFMATVLVGVLCAAALVGCATTPTFNSAATASSKSLEAAAEQVDRYEKLGVITDAQEDKLLDRLKGINAELRRATRLYEACAPTECRSAVDIIAAVNAAITEITNELLKADEAKRSSTGVQP